MCQHEITEEYNHFYQEGRLVEYSVKCCICGRHLNTWSYGSWMDEEC